MSASAEVVIEQRDDIPGGLPAVWIGDHDGTTRLYLRSDMPEHLRQHFRAMCLEAVHTCV